MGGLNNGGPWDSVDADQKEALSFSWAKYFIIIPKTSSYFYLTYPSLALIR